MRTVLPLLLFPTLAWAGPRAVAALPGPGADEEPVRAIEAIAAVEESVIPMITEAVRDGARLRLACLELRHQQLERLLQDADQARERWAVSTVEADRDGARAALALLRQLRARAEDLSQELTRCEALDRKPTGGTVVHGPDWASDEFGRVPSSATRGDR